LVAVITGYNSEVDWPFLFERADILGMDNEFAITLNRISKIKRKPSTVKFGETEHYLQTNM
jgi:DNA polymerase elongation subunit (family B)